MTQEQKLFKLLQVAVENGWVDIVTSPYYQNIVIDNHKIVVTDFKGKDYSVSLDHLVTNWEEGQVSFIEALCEALSLTHVNALLVLSTLNISLATERIRHKWVLQPTSKRLDWLFETFKHLIHE